MLPWAGAAQGSQVLTYLTTIKSCQSVGVPDPKGAWLPPPPYLKISGDSPVCRMRAYTLHALQARSCATQHKHTDTRAGANSAGLGGCPERDANTHIPDHCPAGILGVPSACCLSLSCRCMRCWGLEDQHAVGSEEDVNVDTSGACLACDLKVPSTVC